MWRQCGIVAMSLSRRRHVVAIYLMFDLKSSGKNSLERPIKSLRNCRSRMNAFDIPNSSMHSTWFKICQLFLSPKMCLFTQLEGLDTCDTWSTVILSLQWNTEILEVWSWKLGNLEARLEGELGLNLEGLNWDDPWNVSEPAQSFGTGNTASVATWAFRWGRINKQNKNKQHKMMKKRKKNCRGRPSFAFSNLCQDLAILGPYPWISKIHDPLHIKLTRYKINIFFSSTHAPYL